MINLQEKYPSIIKCGLECREGWVWLLDRLCAGLLWDIEKNGYPPIEVIQIKEKFGGLRFYTQSPAFGTTADVETIQHQRGVQDGRIRMAESLSYYICERCGSTEDVSTTQRGYIQTLCGKCMKEYRNEI
jgi:hypothetical protein